MLGDIAEKIRINSSSLLQALETILEDSNPQCLQSLRVPGWTLLFFKLQSRILDQEKLGKRSLSISKLRRTGVSHNVYIFIKIGKSVFVVLCFVVNVGFVVYQNSLICLAGKSHNFYGYIRRNFRFVTLI